MSDTPQLLREHHLKALRVPTFLRDYDKVARPCAAESVDPPRSLLRWAELELLERQQRSTERWIRAAHFPVSKSLETFAFLAIPSLNKGLVLELARGDDIERRENVLALGHSGTGKTHMALALGLAACQRGERVRFTTAAALGHEWLEAKDDKRRLRDQKQLASHQRLIIDELGFVPLWKSGAAFLFAIFRLRYERSATLVTSHLPFDQWTEVRGSERLTGARLDRLPHHVHILERHAERYRRKERKQAKRSSPRKGDTT
jgi:DNA replication protein DnaC